MAPGPSVSSPWAPFNHGSFTVLWSTTVISNTGTWMNDVGAGWLMTGLAPSPLMVALVQTATTLPVFLFALPAGALADIVDRRRLLLVVTGIMAMVAALFSVLVWSERVNALGLLLFTFLMGSGAAFMAPTWQAIVPSLVPKDALPAAVTLNSVGINLSRAIGPALAGVLIALLGIAWPFLLNALSFLVVIAALYWWRPLPDSSHSLPPERLVGAIRAGLRYARASGPLRATLIRAVGFFLFASAFWALLPLIARQELNGGASLYGMLTGAIGAGAVGGALLLPRLKARLDADRLVMVGTLGIALVMLSTALLRLPLSVGVGCLLFGACWVMVLSSLNVSAQVALPGWVRARGLSVFLTVFFGSMSLGSALWGQLATLSGIAPTLLVAAAGAALAIPMTRNSKLHQGAALDLSPSLHWPAPMTTEENPDGDRGPVMVTLEYRIDPAHRGDFLAALTPLAAARRRDGAFAWGIFEDTEQPGRFLEYFQEDSWLEHLRHHQRVTESDRVLQQAVNAFHLEGDAPQVRHYLAPCPLTPWR